MLQSHLMKHSWTVKDVCLHGAFQPLCHFDVKIAETLSVCWILFIYYYRLTTTNRPPNQNSNRTFPGEKNGIAVIIKRTFRLVFFSLSWAFYYPGALQKHHITLFDSMLQLPPAAVKHLPLALKGNGTCHSTHLWSLRSLPAPCDDGLAR